MIPKEGDGRPKLTGMDLFHHMVTFCNMNHSRVDEDGQHVKILPSTKLNVETSSDALKCIQPTQSELRRANILHDSFGKRAIRKGAKRKLNNIGNMVGHCVVVNDETNMARMRENLTFAESMAEIVRREKADKTQKDRDSIQKQEERAPDAGRKMEKWERKVASLTVLEIESILYRVYNISLSGSKLRKPDYVRALERELSTNLGKYEAFVKTL